VTELIQKQADIIEAQANLIDELQKKVARLTFQLNSFIRATHGSKSEKFHPSLLPAQSVFQPELPFGDIVEEALEQPQASSYTVTRPKKKSETPPSRNLLPEHLERVKKIVEPDHIPDGAVRIGELVSEALEYRPGKLFVTQTIRPKYALADKSAVMIADMPAMPVLKCIAGASLLMRILIDKFVDHMPVYRQQQRFKRDGMNIPSSTISGWLKSVAHLLEPLYDLLVKEVLASSYIGADETHMNVLDRKLKGKTHHGYYWVYLAHEEKLIFFDYDPSRAKGVPGEKLKDYKGYLQTDGYAGYNQFKNSKNIQWLCCMAHARRKFEAALKSDGARSEYALLKMQRLYRLEHLMQLFLIDYDGKKMLRQRIAVPILEELKQWMKNSTTKGAPSEPFIQAISYSLDLWSELTRYTTNGKLQIDNNLVENKIRPVAIGRKNYLFMGSHESAQGSAMMYSFFASCALNNVNPEEWLLDIITRIGETKMPQLHTLLPNNWKKPS